MGQTEKEIIAEQAIAISELKEEMKRELEEAAAEIALLRSEIDRLKNPDKPHKTHYGETNEPG